MPEIKSTAKAVEKLYATFPEKLALARKRLGRPMPFAEKALLAHVDDLKTQDLERGKSYLQLRPDRVAMQDATAQMALLQFAQAGLQAQVPATVHCDHLIRAQTGAAQDLERAQAENKEVYDFLSTVCQKYGIGFWKPGAGIIHQVVLENYAFPAGLMIGTDSHTPNGGGLGMLAVGVGGADAVDVLAGLPWEVKYPFMTGIHLKGKLSGWTSSKDVILKVLELLTVKGGTNHIVQYFGAGAESISATGKGTICNMGAEHGATTSTFPYDAKMAAYLSLTGRKDIAAVCDKNRDLLSDDPEVSKSPEKYFDRVLEIDLDKLEPYVVGPHSPDKTRPISKFAEEIRREGYPDTLKYALIGSCTNSSYEDMGRSAHVARQAKGAKVKTSLMVTPGSDQIFETIKRDGQMAVLENAGATVLANACGPCIGQWKRTDIQAKEKNSIVSSYNRNFPGRNDGNAETLSFLASPEIVTAMALAGRLSFNPLTDSIETADGVKTKLVAPFSEELPAQGFAPGFDGFIQPAQDGAKVEIKVNPASERLQLLKPFAAWNGKDFLDCPLLLKAKGKCTTDHISPAGTWLKFRGHLDRISDNMFLGAVNAFSGEAGKGKDLVSGEKSKTFAATARHYKAEGLRWVVVGDENYGEGSSREHAAMSPRFLGVGAVLVRSFARIHETNLKKQGVLPLAFADPASYDLVKEDDRISIIGLAGLAPGKPVIVELKHADGKSDKVECRHSLSAEQIDWFKAGCALNLLVAKTKKKSN